MVIVAKKITQRIALYGGSFDPIHFGHLIAARSIVEHYGFDRVILIPSGNPPVKNQLTTFSHRWNMIKLAIHGDPLFELSNIELFRPGPSYTIYTVNEYQQIMPTSELFWIIGSDCLAELTSWHRIKELVERVTIIVVARPSLDANRPDMSQEIADRIVLNSSIPQIDISSTDIRYRVLTGKQIRYLVPDSVDDYILQSGLYQ